MRKFIFFLISASTMAQSYAPAAGEEGSTAIAHDSELFVGWATGVAVERGLINIADPNAQHNGSNYASYGDPEDALGPPDNSVVSLGDAGVAILTFDEPITNGNGFDFAVFENGFNDYFLELAFVEVSSDGENYFRFPAHSETQTNLQVGSFGELDPTYLNNFAGKYRAMFGTPFDLDDLDDHPLLDKSKITHVKLIDVVGSIDPDYATYDSYGNKVNDPFPTPFDSGGFDLDAVGVINQYILDVEDFNRHRIGIYPNPATDYFSIENGNKSFDIRIFNTSGKILMNSENVASNEIIDITRLESGMYFLWVQSESKTTLLRLVKR